MYCRKCGSEAFVKNGFMAGAQRYKCKKCGFQFTRETPHGRPMKDKILALVLYLSGLSMNAIGNIIGVSTQSIMRWIRMFYDKFIPQNEIETKFDEIEIDEMYSYINKKKIQSGSGRLLIITLEGFSAGDVVIVVPKPWWVFLTILIFGKPAEYIQTTMFVMRKSLGPNNYDKARKIPIKLSRIMHYNGTGWDVFADGRKLSPGLWICWTKALRYFSDSAWMGV